LGRIIFCLEGIECRGAERRSNGEITGRELVEGGGSFVNSRDRARGDNKVRYWRNY